MPTQPCGEPFSLRGWGIQEAYVPHGLFIQNDEVSKYTFSQSQNFKQVVLRPTAILSYCSLYQIRHRRLTLDIGTTREEPSFASQHGEDSLRMFVQFPQSADDVEYQVAAECVEGFWAVQLLFGLVR